MSEVADIVKGQDDMSSKVITDVDTEHQLQGQCVADKHESMKSAQSSLTNTSTHWMPRLKDISSINFKMNIRIDKDPASD